MMTSNIYILFYVYVCSIHTHIYEKEENTESILDFLYIYIYKHP